MSDNFNFKLSSMDNDKKKSDEEKKPSKWKTILLFLLAMVIGFFLSIYDIDFIKSRDYVKQYMSMDDIGRSGLGDIVKFGRYEQDGNLNNGLESLEWIVIANEGTALLLMSRFAIDVKPYHSSGKRVLWNECTLRTWLNDIFFATAFNDIEIKRVAPRIVEKDAPVASSDGFEVSKKNISQTASETAEILKKQISQKEFDKMVSSKYRDNIFVLSIPELNVYLPKPDSRRCLPSPYTALNLTIDKSSTKIKNCEWWLCSHFNHTAFAVTEDGEIRRIRENDDQSKIAVRPFVWVNR